MKVFLAILTFLHGFIHLLGFLKAHGWLNISEFNQIIPKPVGLIWLLSCILFDSTAMLILLKKEWWPLIALISVLLSQILIILYWKETKFGTIANIIILIASVLGYGEFQFNKMVHNEAKKLLKNINIEQTTTIKKEDIRHLPTIVQKWLIDSNVLGNEKAISIRLSQIGKMKTSPDSKWMPFKANQYFNCTDPSFIWITKVNFLPFVSMSGRDQLFNSEGKILIKLFSLIPVVNETSNENINAASMQRFLAEMCWFPSFAINEHVHWKKVNNNSVKATMTMGEKSVFGVFKFSHSGQLQSFETERFYGGSKDACLEKWLIEMIDYKEFNGIKIPHKCKVSWRLNDGDFNWLNLEITTLEKNKTLIAQKITEFY